MKFAELSDLKAVELATYDQAEKMFTRYMKHLDHVSESKIPLMDIKFNSLQAIGPYFRFSHEKPFIIKMLEKKRTFFVFIRRRNLTEQVLSEYLARATKKWHNLSANDVVHPIRVDIKEAAEKAKLIIQSEQLILPFLKVSQNSAFIEFEELFPDDAVNPQMLRIVAQKFRLQFPNVVRPKIKRNTLDKREHIVNYDAVNEAIKTVEDKSGRMRFELPIGI